ncbi:MAG: PAS domain S-box protein, partial [Desulfatitalea sp.]
MRGSKQQPVLKILLISDNPNNAARVKALLAGKGAVAHELVTKTRSDALKAMGNDTFSVVLWGPDANSDESYETLQMVLAGTKHAAIVVLTDTYNVDLAPALARLGVQDYLQTNRLNGKWLWRAIAFAAARKRSENPPALSNDTPYTDLQSRLVDHEKTVESLRQSRERYRSILDNIDAGYFEVDLTGKFTFFNDTLCKIIGVSRDELTGMKHRQYMDEGTAAKITEIYKQIYTTGEPNHQIIYSRTRNDGKTIHIESSVSLIKDAGGRPVGFRGLSKDVTDRKQAEEELRQSEERYRTILEGIEEGYFENDLQGDMTFVNDALCKMVGYTKEELIGLKFNTYM